MLVPAEMMEMVAIVDMSKLGPAPILGHNWQLQVEAAGDWFRFLFSPLGMELFFSVGACQNDGNGNSSGHVDIIGVH